MRHFTQTKLDANQAEVIKDVQSQGVHVTVLHEPVDTFMHNGTFGGFVEIKVKGRTMYTKKQIKWMAMSGPVPVAIVKSAEDVMRFLNSRQGLTQAQKDGLAAFLVGNDLKMWNAEQIERVLKG
jgi:hypothetical protein